MTTLIVIGSIVGYSIIGGLVGRVVMERVRSTCYKWKLTKKARETGERLLSYEECDLDDHLSPYFAGAFWPVAFPVVVGLTLGSWLVGREDRAVKREQRKQADHERKMAEFRAQERLTMDSVKFLVENGIRAEVPGLYDAGDQR